MNEEKQPGSNTALQKFKHKINKPVVILVFLQKQKCLPHNCKSLDGGGLRRLELATSSAVFFLQTQELLIDQLLLFQMAFQDKASLIFIWLQMFLFDGNSRTHQHLRFFEAQQTVKNLGAVWFICQAKPRHPACPSVLSDSGQLP